MNNRVYLRDFAEIIDGTENQRVFVLLNGKSAVKISIQKQPEANTITVVDGVKARLKQLQASGIIPPEALITTTLDESQFIRNSIANLTTSGLIGTTLAAIAVLLFLGSWRQTFIIVLAIPLATLAAMILMGLFHLSLNIFSLGGLALGVGIVVDNSIVMLENITQGFKARLEGHFPNYSRIDSQTIIQQAQASSQEVESALVASTSTNLVTVLPFLLIGGFISLIFNELILTISFAVGASIVVAITVVPMLASRMLAWQFSSNLSNFWLLKKFNNRFDTATKTYTKVLAKILRQRLLTLLLILIFLGSGSFWMAKQIPQEILPRINTGQAALFARFPSGTSLEINQKVMTAVDEILLSQPETEYVFLP